MLTDYLVQSGSSDELFDAQGSIRPVWRPFLSYLAGLDGDDVARRFARGDQYLHDAGVFYRQYGATGSTERAWPLSHVPVLIHETEWRTLEAGLIQRAELLEQVVADLYGGNRLVTDGHLPAEIVAASPEWLRPLVGVRPRSGRYLHFIAFEVGRGPDGAWWVLGDRTQAPSGAGFALENRVASSRVFADFVADAKVRDLASFFRSFRDAARGLRADKDGQVAVLTPGPMNDTYYEHAYIARHLGFGLLEGEDLTVERGRLLARTVSGLAPIAVLWRRIDSSFADPLELEESSRLGTPGLVGAVRSGQLELINALGSGVLETRAFLAFLPRLCEALRGESLKLPNIATWWCGQPVEAAQVKAQAGRMMLSPADSTSQLFDPRDPAVSGVDAAALAARVDADGRRLVGQEAATLSTTPAYVEGRLQARPMALRVFLARTAAGWTVMPGGYARIGRSEDASAIAMQRGGSVADVWIVGDAPPPSIAVDAAAIGDRAAAFASALPSRSADNLYWLGRYVERAAAMIRLRRAHHLRLVETPREDAPLPAFIEAFRRHAGLDAEQALGSALAAALASAGRVRDRISVDGWAALSELVDAAGELKDAREGDDAVAAMGALLRKVTGFAGLVHENMYRATDWRFLAIGRSLERAMMMTSILGWLADPGAPEGALDVAVEMGDSASIHRRRYASAPTRATVVELLAFDTRSPRSIRFQLDEICEHVAALPGAEERGLMSSVMRTAHVARTSLLASTPETLSVEALDALWSELAGLSEQLSDAYLR
jgi:uncharacterized circularly permuted ATP-grasp superfamily protein/uncharacterized alpha-E superfamily protein